MAKFTNVFLVVVFLYFVKVEARNKSPLLDEENTRVRSRNAECVFGKEVKELGSQWIPDLGVPIGVLYCMRCECMPLQRKNRIVARVKCRNIESECPAVTCDEPVLKKGQCCKMCPDTNHSPNEGLDIIARQPSEDEERNNKHFSALLTGRSSLVLRNELMPNDINKNNIVATGRFTFTKKNLHYSFYVSEKAARPRQLQFRDNLGNILEEFTLSDTNSLYQNATRKVCGVWRRLPREYRRLLKQGRMYVVLIWGVKDDSEVMLSGQILKYVALSSETFSALLEPAPGSNAELMLGSGGTAVVSISAAVPSSLHLAIVFNGLFAPEETARVPVRVTLGLDDRKLVLDEVVTVDKTSYALNLVEVSASVDLPSLRSLTRAKLMLTVSSLSSPVDLRLSGNVITKVTCELFQTVLTSSPTDVAANPDGTSGLAWLYLNNDGSMVYNIHIDNLRLSTYALTMSDVSTKRRTELEDFSPDFKDGWANGTLDRLSPKYLDPLYSGNMAIGLQTSTDNLMIRGKLSARFVDDARDSPAPVLLKRYHSNRLATSAAGLAWISVDNECHLHYDVTLSGIDKLPSRKFELSLEMLPMLAPGAPAILKHLDRFDGNQIDGSPIETLTTEEIARLSNGVCYLKIKDATTTLLTATLKQVNVPTECRYYNNNIPLTYNGDPATMPPPPGTCFHQGRFYDEEKQWTSPDNPCQTCFCQNGVANCDTMQCPKLNCTTTKIDGECCPICSTLSTPSTNQTKCTLNGKPYYPGSKFNPFLIPTGFDRCTECTCDPISLDIKCQRLSEKQCCSNCSDQSYNVQSDVTPSERKELPDVQKVLKEGGCKNARDNSKPFANNSTYHPFIDSLGEYKCVTCTCRNGNQECKRESCDLEACNRRREKRRKKEPIKDICCSAKECRKLRHKKNRL